MIYGVSFIHILIIKIETAIFCKKFCRGSLVRFLHMVYFPIFNINPQLSYYRCWCVRNIIFNTPFFQLVVKNFIIIIPYMYWIIYVNIKPQFTLCNPSGFNTRRCIKMLCFSDTSLIIADLLTDFIVLK